MNFFISKNLKPASLACTTMLAGLAMLNTAYGQSPESDKEAKPETPKEEANKNELKVIKLSEHVYQLGKVTFNKKTREIMIPATAEIVGAEVVEYALVTSQGKIHESLFITDAKPSHVNIAFKLLGYKEAKYLFRKVNKNFQPQEDYETSTDEEKKKSKFHVNASWTVKGEKKSYPIEELVSNPRNDQKLESTPWVYGGSFVYKGSYVADKNNDILAIFTDRAAVANYAGEGREDDTLWSPNSKVLPRHGTAVTITLSPHKDKVEAAEKINAK